MTSTIPTATASSTPSADWGRDVRALLRAGLRGQGRRLLSAGLAVGLGVMFLAVTLLLSDTLAAGLRTQVAGSIGDYTAVVSDDSGEITPAQEQTVRRTTGVAAVEAVQSRTIISGGNTVVGLATAPTQGRGSYPQGRAPRTDGEIALTENALAALSVDVGGTVSVPAESGPPGAAAEPVVLRVVGVVEPSGDTTFPTSMPAGVATNATMSRLAGKTSYLELRVVGTPGTSPEQLRDALAAAIDPGPSVRTGAEEVDHRVQQLAGGHDLLTRSSSGSRPSPSSPA
ncbi:ABC transporter permease [Mobilicoccus sp.]|uniref:ABC transporter permease n=1 Tax=Mobilicoccus sp. TaxID=2034349 RepID=UPI0028A75788|nr:ABC transporter permease [Mobilicoccus sp.]